MTITNHLHDLQIPSLLYFVDIEKRFDRVEWNCLKLILAKMKIGPHFLLWMQLIYTNQSAEIVLVGLDQGNISSQRSRSRACPMSPLLFDILIEALAIAI